MIYYIHYIIANQKIKVELQYKKSENEIKPKIIYSKEHKIKNETIDLKNEIIKFDKIEISKGSLIIYLLINQKKVENNINKSQNFFSLKLNEIKSTKDFQDYSWTIVNNIKIKLKLKIISENNNNNINNNNNNKNISTKASANIKLIQKEENILDNEKVYKPTLNFNNGSLNMKERLKIFNKNNNASGLPIKSEPNSKKEPPKKLIINPNLYGKDGKIKIITSKDKVNTNKQKKENLNNNIKDNNNINNTSNNDKKANEMSLQAFLYGDSTEGDENDISKKNTKNEKISKPINKKKIQEKPKKNEKPQKKTDNNDFLENNITKKKSENLSSNLQDVLESLQNPKSQSEQQEIKEKQTMAYIRPKKLSLGEKKIKKKKNLKKKLRL